MSTYCAKTLSNPVRVKDVNEFEKIIKSIEPSSEIIIEKNAETSVIQFYSNSSLHIEDDGLDIIKSIQNLLEDNEVLVIKEIGYENFINFYSDAYMISNDYIDHVDFNDMIQDHIEQRKQSTISFAK